MFEEIESSRLSSVTIGANSITSISDINVADLNDIESQINKLKQNAIENQNQQQPKSILKRTSADQDDEVSRKILVYSIWIVVLIICLPIIVCDLYFAYNDETCLNDYPANIDLNLKQYLIVSAFTSLIIINIYMTLMNYFTKDSYNDNMCLIIWSFVFIGLLGIFALIWNILGAVIFWGYIYGNGNCSRKVSTYLFVSLIIKFVFTAQSYKATKKATRE
jgi:predicted secreted protein